jgi:hypothetical protein
VYWSQENPLKMCRVDFESLSVEEIPVEGPFLAGPLAIEYSLNVPAMGSGAVAVLTIVVLVGGVVLLTWRTRKFL